MNEPEQQSASTIASTIEVEYIESGTFVGGEEDVFTAGIKPGQTVCVITKENLNAILDERRKPWTYCPECGSEKIHHEEGDHKQCGTCYQEWFSSTDYSGVVQENLSDLRSTRISRVDILEYEIGASSWWCDYVSIKWMQSLVAKYFAWKVNSKTAQRQKVIARKIRIEEAKKA